MLSNKSIYIQSHLENISKINDYKKVYYDNEKFSKKTRHKLNEIFKTIYNIYNEWDIYKIKIFNTFIIRKKPFYLNDSSMTWIPLKIREHINKFCIKHYDCTINGKYYNFIVHFSGNTDMTILKISTYCRLINTFLRFIESYVYKKCEAKNVHVIICLTDLDKTFKYNSYVSKNDVNSAFTTRCGNIYIFRKEEWFKSLIHETLHHYMIGINEELKVSDIFTVNKLHVNLDETYVETWAELINNMFIVSLTYDEKHWISKFYQHLFYEFLFSTFQGIKYLNQHNLKYENILSNKEKITLRENTFAFSYYVIKMIVMSNSINYLNNTIPCYENFLDISRNTNHIVLFEDVILKSWKSKQLLNCIEIINKSLRNTKKNEMLFKTARFSLFEFKF